MSVDWPRWAGEITRLYVTEDKSAEETIQILRDQHNVKVTIRQFKRRYSGLKKLRANEWRAVKRVIQKRKADGKDSAVFLNNRQIDPNRLAREMRRYCGARSRDSTGDNIAIDLGIDTMDKHRLEIRTPISEFTQYPNESPRFRGIAAGNATVSVGNFVEDSTNEHVLDASGWVSHFELENLDLRTPDLGTAEASFCAGSLHDVDRMINNTETHRDTSWSLQGDESTLIEGRQYQMECENPRRSPFIDAHGLSCLPPKSDHTIWSNNLWQSTFFILPDVSRTINSLEASNPFVSDNMIRLQQLVGTYSEPQHHRSSTFLNPAVMQSTSSVLQLVSTITNEILGHNDSTSLPDDVTALESLFRTDKRMLHLVFSAAIHHCCNSTMLPHELYYFCKWILYAKVKKQLLVYLQKCPAASNAFAEALLRLLPASLAFIRSTWRDLISHIDEAEEDFIQIIEIYRDESAHISIKVCGQLLHAVIACLDSIDLLDLLIARGAKLDTVADIEYRTSGRIERHKGTPLVHATYQKKSDFITFFLEQAPTKEWELHEHDVCNALIIALKIKYYRGAELLLSKGAEIFPHTCMDSILDRDVVFARHKQEQHAKREGFPLLCQLLNRQRTLLSRVVDAAASGSQALSNMLFDQNIVQDRLLEIALCQGVKSDNELAVRTLLQRGTDPNARNRQTGCQIFGDVDPGLLLSATLQMAIDYQVGDNIVALLCKAGAHIDEAMLSRLSCHFRDWERNASQIYSILRRHQSDIFGASALALAATDGAVSGIDLLLELGAPINLHGVRGKTALQAASSGGNLLVVQFLLDQGADANVPAYDDGGRTALQAAVENGYARVAKCLLDAKADIRAPPAKENGMTVLEAFAYYELKLSRKEYMFAEDEGVTASEFRGWVSQGAPINRPDGDHGNILHIFIRSRFNSINECLEIALQAGARIEDRDQSFRGQKTPLQVAAEVGNLDSVRLLLKYGANVHALPGDEFGQTALQAAACGEKISEIPAMVGFLLSLGADVNAPPARKGGITALQGAAISGDTSIAQILLNHGADVNAAPAVEEGRTAIEGAAEHGRLDMVRFLISVGAAGDPEKGFGRAIELAESENHSLIADFLRDQQDLSAGFGMGMDDMFGGDMDFLSQVPSQGFVFSEENLENFTFH